MCMKFVLFKTSYLLLSILFFSAEPHLNLVMKNVKISKVI